MSKINFIINKMKSMDHRKMLQRADDIAKENNRSQLVIFMDMIYCGFRYQAGYENYAAFNFCNVPDKLRSTYLTRGGNNTIIDKYNAPEYRIYFDDKSKFMKTFREYTKRDYLDLRNTSKEDFISWAKTQDTFVAKIIDSDGGRGVSKYITSLIEDMGGLYDEFQRTRAYIVETTVQQHQAMSALNPSSVNTIRVYTIYRADEDKVYIPYAFVRIGREGFTDNYSNGGMTSKLDLDTGRIMFPCSDKNGTVYEKHPITQTEFVGYTIPMWQEIIHMCKKAAKVIPQVGYVGWDVAVGEESPLFIEGNAYPGNGIPQNPNFLPDKIGMKPLMEEITGLKL
ncbi:MAG: hypothetical protein E7218_08120 [Anaerofustis stercorihominis]|nr:hypothetical protein [Anaerofustis stercorihominis]